MTKYDGQVVRQRDGFTGVILKMEYVEGKEYPNYDIDSACDPTTYEEAAKWVHERIHEKVKEKRGKN